MEDDDENEEIIPLDDEEEQLKPILSSDDYNWPLIKDVIATPEFHNKLEDIVNTIRHPEIFELLGIKQPKTYLFDGPPGTGKTLSAKAIRNELMKQGYNVIWHPYDTGTYGTAFINMGAVNMQKYFNMARALIQRNFMVLDFIDEAETILGKRGMNNTSAGKEDTKVLNNLMKNLQEINSYSDKHYVIFATNYSSMMDAAAVRAGRINKVLLFELPGVEELKAAYRLYIKGVNDKADFQLINNVNINQLASESRGFNYADVSTIVQGSVETLAYELLRMGVDIEEPPSIGNEYLINRIKEYKTERKGLSKNINKNLIGFLGG